MCCFYFKKVNSHYGNRLVHYGQSQHYYCQYSPYGQAISGPDSTVILLMPTQSREYDVYLLCMCVCIRMYVSALQQKNRT